MAPGHQPEAGGRSICLFTKRKHLLRRFDDRLKNDLDRNRSGIVQRLGNLPGMGSDLFKRFRPVKMLAARDEPNFKPFQISHVYTPTSSYSTNQHLGFRQAGNTHAANARSTSISQCRLGVCPKCFAAPTTGKTARFRTAAGSADNCRPKPSSLRSARSPPRRGVCPRLPRRAKAVVVAVSTVVRKQKSVH